MIPSLERVADARAPLAAPVENRQALGREVEAIVADTGETVTGTVTEVRFTESGLLLVVGDRVVPISDLVSVR